MLHFNGLILQQHSTWHWLQWSMVQHWDLDLNLVRQYLLPFKHNCLKWPQWHMNMHLQVCFPEVDGGYIFTLLLPLPQLVCTDVCIGHGHVNLPIQLSVVHYKERFCLVLLHACHWRNRALWSSKFLLVAKGNKPALVNPHMNLNHILP